MGNADTIEYQYDKINLSNIKHNPLGKSTRDIHHRRKIGRKLFKRAWERKWDEIYEKIYLNIEI